MCQDVSKSEMLTRGLAAAERGIGDLRAASVLAVGGDGNLDAIERGLACLKDIAADLRAALAELEKVTAS
jgi:hypothetical protein